uniref:Glycosyltransferase n=1 Tax=Viola tricolor TaxID=214053 RepID=A0AA51Z2M5_9ROSI|nr:C-glucosyltransferase [Viola tricolor]
MDHSGAHNRPHVALLPSAGMGHLTPTLRLAASLANHGLQVTLIVGHPIVSAAESKLISRFLSAFPADQVREKQFDIVSVDPATVNSKDPFFIQREATRRSLQILPSLVSSLSPPISALVSDVFLMSPVLEATANLKDLPQYILFTSSARMFSLFASYHTFFSETSPDFSKVGDFIETPFPGVVPIPKSSLPPPLRDPKTWFASTFMEDSKKLSNFDGVLINTFEKLESDSLKGGKLPPLFTVGLVPCEFEKGSEQGGSAESIIKWLDDKEPGSVVYISFGSRTTMMKEQIKEMGEGLVRSGCPFLWVVKDKIVDKEDNDSLEDVIGDAELVEKMKEKGLVVKEWVDQGEVLGHKSVGGFVSHCGWNSVVEAAWYGVRLLGWPQSGDQRINAEVVERSGLGVWAKDWGWMGERVIKGQDIGGKIGEIMRNDLLKSQAEQIGEEARKAVGDGGSCENAMKELIGKWKNE